MNKKVIGIIIATVVVVGGAYLLMQSPKTNTNTQSPTNTNTNSQNPVSGTVTTTTTTTTSNATGRVVFAISDATLDMSTISQINMTVSSIEIYNQANGWVTVSGTPQTYNLLDLNAKNQSKIFSDFQAPVGTYDQMRLTVDKIVVVTKAGVTQEAKLPSGVLKINTTLVVKNGGTSSVNFDFLADKSLHMTGNGGYIFAPVVKTQTKSDVNATVNGDNTVKVDGGHVDTDATAGMDINGDVKANFQLNATDKFDVINGVIQIHGTQNNNTNNKESVFNFNAQNNSGVSGTATLSEGNGSVKVTLNIKDSILGLLTPAEPAHIHLGSCENIGSVKYPLTSVVNGKSETTLNISLAQLKAELPLAINIHKSAAESNIYIACTDLNF